MFIFKSKLIRADALGNIDFTESMSFLMNDF